MSPRLYPFALLLAVTGADAAHALGLGEIRLDSALNEPLAAEIDIVSSTAEELSSLTAAIAGRETFQAYGSERPAFLTSTTFKLIRNDQGRPALAVRSTAPFTEPFVNLLIDVHWPGGELVREYPLLLDPAVYPATRSEAESSPGTETAAATAAVSRSSAGASPDSATTAAAAASPPVAPKHTRARTLQPPGTRVSPPTAAAPSAPQATQPSAPSDADALAQRLESLEQSLAQMQALVQQQNAEVLRLRAEASRNLILAEPPLSPSATAPVPVAAANPTAVSTATTAAATPTRWGRVLSLLGALALVALVLALLRRRHDETPYPALRYPLLEKYGTADDGVPRPGTVASDAPAATDVPVAGTAAMANAPAANAPVANAPVAHASIAGGARAASGAAAPRSAQTSARVNAPDPDATGIAQAPDWLNSNDLTQVTREMPANPGMAAASPTDATARLPAIGETTISLAVDGMDLDDTLVDFEGIETHVQLPSALKENVVVTERRTNLADVLKGAIAREPDRRDLSLKLLELYHDAAATNRRAFLEIARTLARDRDAASAAEWDRVENMGRQIAADDELFTPEGAERK